MTIRRTFASLISASLLAACSGPAGQVRSECPPCAAQQQAAPTKPAAAPEQPSPAPSREELMARYRAAVKDAETVEPGEISRELWPVTRYNQRLKWKEDRVLVLTWTGWGGYDAKKDQYMPLSREVWITLVPELADFCREKMKPGQAMALRLEQLLGLPPGNGKDRFVELWVKPEDMFRPAPDPEVTDSQAELDVPVSTKFVKVSDEHLHWFDQLKGSSYGEKGYPWTRLGYTYDWGNPDSEVGLSEFVVRKGAVVQVNAVIKNADYCKPGGEADIGVSIRALHVNLPLLMVSL